ncbi:MAG TPA: hypothetical protein VHS96_09575 [Bacteroidia bacterium]|nr:hypothetical protein [Bacteroidia bacterium]
MVARIVLDVVNDPLAPGMTVGLSLLGFFVLIVAVEGGVLTLFGMRPISKAFTSSFILNMAAIGTGLVLYLIGDQMGLDDTGLHLFVIAAATIIQALILGANRVNLTRGRAWFAAVAMKAVSLVVLFILLKILGI